MSRLIDADLLDITEITTDDYSGNEVLDVVLKEDIDSAETVKAIPIEKLEQIREEIKTEILSHSGTGEEVIQAYADGLNHSLRLIDKAIKEQSDDD